MIREIKKGATITLTPVGSAEEKREAALQVAENKLSELLIENDILSKRIHKLEIETKRLEMWSEKFENVYWAGVIGLGFGTAMVYVFLFWLLTR